MLGMDKSAQTVKNFAERPEAILNLVDPAMVAALDRIALLTGTEEISDRKRARGYRYEPDKFAAGGLTREPSDVPGLDAVEESPITLEGRIVNTHNVGGPDGDMCAFEMTIERVRVREDLLMSNDRYIDPLRWDPLIMKFTEYFANGSPVYESSLARGWDMPPLSSVSEG
jgi:flavin reductase (DIM6/NTAB) family NADH-FMN oxidoreductase RutF